MMNVMRDEYGKTPDKYWSLLASFDRECTAKGKQHASMDDYKRHFYDWTRRHIEINGKDGSKNKGKGYGIDKDRQGRKDGRRGRDNEIRGNVDNMLSKYGLSSNDIGM